MRPIRIIRADLTQATQATAMVELLDAYARDPMGGGRPLSDPVRQRLPQALAARSYAHSLLAWDRDTPVGLLNAFEGFSTFAALPLLNIHDITVLPSHRGQGIGRQLLEAAQHWALELGCCKLTLEVLQGNQPARTLYRQFGFQDYQLDPASGSALFLEKPLGDMNSGTEGPSVTGASCARF